MNQKININKKLINKSEAARQLGISQPYVSLLLSGKRKNDKLLKKILEVVKNAAKES